MKERRDYFGVRYLLLVEGKDEEKIFTRELSLPGQRSELRVEAYAGKDNLVHYLLALSKATGVGDLQKVVVLRDNDHDPKGASQSVSEAIKKARLVCPVIHLEVPGPGKIGALEALWIAAIDPCSRKCIEEFHRCRSATESGKSVLSAYLSTVAPGSRLNEAINMKRIDSRPEAFVELLENIVSVFCPS